MNLAIIQARMGATRLPRKVLADICGKPMLQRVIERTQECWVFDRVVVATTYLPEDDDVEELCHNLNVRVFRGHIDDVLSRFYLVASKIRPDTICRITGDCPLIDSYVVEATFRELKGDYASNCLKRTFPRGLDNEHFTFEALEKAFIRDTQTREHVTPYIYRSGLFRTRGLENPADYSHYRWTVDEQSDLDFVRAVYSELDDKCSWKEVVNLLELRPDIARINEGVKQKER